jgi:hypothetical protein
MIKVNQRSKLHVPASLVSGQMKKLGLGVQL